MATEAYWNELMKALEEMPDEAFARLVDEVCAEPETSFALKEDLPVYLTTGIYKIPVHIK